MGEDGLSFGFGDLAKVKGKRGGERRAEKWRWI